MKLKATCDTTYKADKHSGTRPVSAIRWVVMHDTEGGTARAIALYFASPLSGGSTHLVVDDENCFRCLRNDQIPWAAPGANYSGFHIEMCGWASWSPKTWLSHIRMLRRAAYKTALHCKLFGLPPVFRTAADLKQGKKGVTTHAEITKAFPGGSHTDPGVNFPLKIFMGLVRYYYKSL